MIDYFNTENSKDFDAIKISIASPDQIRSNSFGEVTRPDTVNYRTIKPENGGLFCARIFGPVKDYECNCGKYKRMKHKGIVCEKCGVEVTISKVRRDRMGHIELASPVVHIWFLRSLPSRISLILDVPLKKLESVINYDAYIVSDPGKTILEKGQLISEDDYHKFLSSYGTDSFAAGIGAEIIKDMLRDVNLVDEQQLLRNQLKNTKSETTRKKVVKRLKLIEDFLDSGNNIEDMVMEVLPVIPPDLRPLVMLDGGRFATSDLNELYRRVINRNNRLKRLLELKAPIIIIRNEKRMLQESVDALFDNSRKSKIIRGSNKRPLKSLSDMLKGKYGRFRQNLLGKRVDYSGRSVIVVGPKLKLHQCGIPKRIALELMKPFIYSKLELYGISLTIKAAKQIVEDERPEVWDILEEVITEHPILLNRAPTLHRLGIQAFEPVLIEGKAIQLHPLVCEAFNADFDGDQMAIHIPLSLEAQLEAKILMMSTNNILSPANGEPVIVPDQDIVLGIYYLSLVFDGEKGTGMIFASIYEVEHAIDNEVISIHAKIKCRVNNNIITSTAGRLFIANVLPPKMVDRFSMVNRLMTKNEISTLVDKVYRLCGHKETVLLADKLMSLGFKYASISGISISKDDMIVPNSKKVHVENSLSKIIEYDEHYSEGLITAGERYNKVIDQWSKCTEDITHDMLNVLSTNKKCSKFQDLNSIFIMADSGARGSVAQIRQLSGIRGLMTKPTGEIIETPIISNFKEGLTELEYFISTRGARKGLADTALKTANSGYLTRKLVDVAQDSIIVEHDCGTKRYITARIRVENGEIVSSLKDLVLGRVIANDLFHNKKLLVAKNILIDESIMEIIDSNMIEEIKVRSVLMCSSKFGVCAKCYGRNLSTGKIVDMGEAVGVIAAQSIGEPGTQLTMRTFHIGGAAQKITNQSDLISPYSGYVKYTNSFIIANKNKETINMSKNCEVTIIKTDSLNNISYKVPYGAKLYYSDGSQVKIGEKIAEWDPFMTPIISEVSGYVSMVDIVDNVSVQEVIDQTTGVMKKVVIENNRKPKYSNLSPRIVVKDMEGNHVKLQSGMDAKYFLPVNSYINVLENDKIEAGDVLARISTESSKTKDITGGLPRVVELFEARVPKDVAILSDIDGYIKYGKDYKFKRRIIVESSEDKKEYFIPRGRHINVNEGDYVLKGNILSDGGYSPHDILRIMGVEHLANYIISEVQQVYRLQGVKINNKHIETILRQMLKKIEVVSPGETTLLKGEIVDIDDFEQINAKAKNSHYKAATGKVILQGITKASLQTRSFLSSASFQETIRILTESSIASRVDTLRGLKENVIVGRLIPAGTGFYVNELKKQE